MYPAALTIAALAVVAVGSGAEPAIPEAKESTCSPIRADGRWVQDATGQAVPPREFERGLQTSALIFWKNELLSIGDQRAEWPGRILRIDPKTARLQGAPILPDLEEPPGEDPLFKDYRSIPNHDFEGLTVDPKDPSILYGVTEDKRMWIVRFRIEGSPLSKAKIDRITQLEFPSDLKSYRDDTNYRLEGIALSDDGKTMYLAWERAADGLPRIFCLPAGEGTSGKTARPAAVPVDFAGLKPRPDKPNALLNVNEIQFLRKGGRPFLLAIARDQERLILIDIDAGKVGSSVDLDLRAPDGDPILWVSPEGLAIDPASDLLWLISDPDSIRGNYRKAKDQTAEGNFAAMAPLLYEMKLSAVLGDPAGK